MAKSIEAYRDERGQVHDSPSAAVIADIAAALGRVGDEGGLTNGVAKLILSKRKKIEKAFADLDRLELQQVEIIETVDEANIHHLEAVEVIGPAEVIEPVKVIKPVAGKTTKPRKG